MERLFLAVFLTIIMAASVNAQSTLHLQEKCAEIVKKFMAEAGISREKNGESTFVDYASHYNKKLDKCFVLISWTITIGGQTQIVQDLWNAIEQKEIGYYYSAMVGLSWKNDEKGCKVGDTICHSKAEFETLIKPYMEE
jgi:hypothetical protein